MAQINTSRVKFPKGWQPPADDAGASEQSAVMHAPLPDTFNVVWYARIWIGLRVAWKTIFATDQEIGVLQKWLSND